MPLTKYHTCSKSISITAAICPNRRHIMKIGRMSRSVRHQNILDTLQGRGVDGESY